MKGRGYIILYVVLSVLYVMSMAVNMWVENWFEYCYWRFGLIFATSFTDIDDFSDETSIAGVQVDACGSLRSLIERTCSGGCGHIGNFRVAGLTLFFFAMLSGFTTVMCIFFHLRKLNDPKIKIRSISFFMALPFVFFAVGLITYSILCQFSKLTTNNHSKDFTPKEGFYLALGNIILCLFIFVLGLLKSKRLMKTKLL